MEENLKMYVWDEAVEFIQKRCDLSRETIETVLSLEEEYMIEIGIMTEA